MISCPLIRHRIICGLLFISSLSACSPSPDSTRGPNRKTVATAKAKFDEYCKTKAGEKLYRVVEDVEGVYLLKLRPEKPNFNDQFAMDDPYGHDSGGEYYISSFLRALIFHPERSVTTGSPRRRGYLYVEAIDPEDRQRYRYTGSWKNVLRTSDIMNGGDGKTQYYSNEFVLNKTPAKGPALRYGVTYDDISTSEDRKYWIAGSSLRVLDLQTNEVIAERIGYMWDPGQGNENGGRSPWLSAADHACPDFLRFKNAPYRQPGFTNQRQQTEDFVEKILIPKVEK
ncbi:MAG: hypothetical protein QM776_18385 [Rhodocyclaceae bacterium]